MKRLFQSLLAKYMLLILLAMFIVQAAYLIIALFVFGVSYNSGKRKIKVRLRKVQ